MRQHRPELRVVVSSGFSSSYSGTLSQDVRIDGSLEKPYTFMTMRKALESVLD